MAEEADLGVLIRKTGGGGEFVEDITPALRRIERGVDHREVGGHAGIFQVAQPLLFLRVQLRAGPVDGVGGVGIKTFKAVVGGAVFVVIALHAGEIELADHCEAFLGIGVVANDVAQANDVRGILAFDVGQHGLERFQIGVDVGDDGVFHSSVNNLKSVKFILRLAPRHVFVADETSKSRATDGLAERLEFLARALGGQFDTPVG